MSSAGQNFMELLSTGGTVQLKHINTNDGYKKYLPFDTITDFELMLMNSGYPLVRSTTI